MLSYALASLTPVSMSGEDENIRQIKDYKGGGIFGFIKDRSNSVIRELEKYGQPKSDIINRLSDVLENHNLYVTMLVAADHWYRGNEKPREFTPDMFTFKNIHFLEMSNTSFGSKKAWDRDAFISLLTYANLLRNEVYLENDNIEVVASPDEDDDLDYGAYDNIDDDDE